MSLTAGGTRNGKEDINTVIGRMVDEHRVRLKPSSWADEFDRRHFHGVEIVIATDHNQSMVREMPPADLILVA